MGEVEGSCYGEEPMPRGVMKTVLCEPNGEAEKQ